MKPIFYKQQTGDTERIHTWEPQSVLLGFILSEPWVLFVILGGRVSIVLVVFHPDVRKSSRQIHRVSSSSTSTLSLFSAWWYNWWWCGEKRITGLATTFLSFKLINHLDGLSCWIWTLSSCKLYLHLFTQGYGLFLWFSFSVYLILFVFFCLRTL